MNLPISFRQTQQIVGLRLNTSYSHFAWGTGRHPGTEIRRRAVDVKSIDVTSLL